MTVSCPQLLPLTILEPFHLLRVIEMDGTDRGKGKRRSDSQSCERPCEKLRKTEFPFASVTRFLFYLLNRV